MVEILALIPARGGSKGIPEKNVLEIGGQPLIAYSIQQAIDSTMITRVIVSTDDKKIAEISLSYGAEVPFMRPKVFSQDLSPDIDVFLHAIRWLRNEENYQPELIVHLRPTSPVRNVTMIDKAIQKILDYPEADAIRSVSPALHSPYKMWKLVDNERMEPLLTIEGKVDCQSMARQELPQVCWQNGYIDALRPRAVTEHHSMWGRSVIPFFMEGPSLDLDYPEDIPAVEHALRNGIGQKSNSNYDTDRESRHSV